MNPHAPTLALTFLDPAAGLVAGAVAAPILVLFYFLKLRRRPLRVSSTLLWERAIQDLQVNTPFRWLRPTLLLLLQLLALALLAAALARPALSDGQTPTGRVILLIDRSASMSATDADDDGSTRLDAAKQRAADLLRRLNLAQPGRDGAAQAMVIAFAADPRVVEPFTASLPAALAALERIDPTDQPADLDAALRLARAFTAAATDESDDPGPGATVFLFSDGALPRPPPDQRENLGAADFRFVRVGPPPAAPRDNLGIVALSARRDEQSPAVVRVFLRLENAGQAPIDAPVTLTLDGDPIAAQRARVPGFSSAPPPPDPAQPPAQPDDPAPPQTPTPGELVLTFAVDAPEGGLLRARIDRDDDLDADNDAAMLLRPPGGARALLVAPTEPAAPDAGPDPAARLAPEPALAQALDALNLRSVRAVSAADYDARLADGSLTQLADLVVFDRVRPSRLPPTPSISFGAGLPIPGLGVTDPAADDQPPLPPTRFLSWRRAHPLMRHVVLDAVIVARPLELSLPTGAEDAATLATPLAFGDAGPLIALLEHAGVQRVVVAFELARSTWPLNYSFAVFLTNAVDALTGAGADNAASALRTTDTASVPIAAPPTGPVRLLGPITRDIPASRALSASSTLALGVLERAGVYRVEGVGQPQPVLPVNLADPDETLLASADRVDIAGETAAARSVRDAAPREIWSWFVLAALAVASVEWLLFAWRMRV